MTDNILSALDYLDAADFDHDGWVRVAMALKSAGCEYSVFDDWSRKDPRPAPHGYDQRDCERAWRSVSERGGVTEKTIFKLAREKGWKPPFDNRQTESHAEKVGRPYDLIKYLSALHDSDDMINIVTESVKDGDKFRPSGSGMTMKVGELITTLKKYPDDIRKAIPGLNPDAGAWVRINPVDGRKLPGKHAMADENITKFKYALVESDDIPIPEQERFYRKMKLPVAAMVSSGKRSVHAIVRVDASDSAEYKERVAFLFDYCNAHGLPVDTQNQNCSRLSRLPGVQRGDQMQKLIDVNVGCGSWNEWLLSIDMDGLPETVSYTDEYFSQVMPPLKPVLIEGILRQGHKMIIAGESKAGKSFLLIELGIALAEGTKWMNAFQCRRSRVLYMNLEVDGASFDHRVKHVYDALKIQPSGNFKAINLRGKSKKLADLKSDIIHRMQKGSFDVLAIDPIYKLELEDENSAAEVAAFCNQIDAICTETGASVILCHHFAKGKAGAKKSIDRSSGSGVFARDPDAILSMSPLVLDEHIKATHAPDETAWRIEATLREFKNMPPIDVWFSFPIHAIDETGLLKGLGIEGSAEAAGTKAGNQTKASRADQFKCVFDLLSLSPDGAEGVPVADMAAYMEKTERTIMRWLSPKSPEGISELCDGFEIKEAQGGKVICMKSPERMDDDEP